MNDDAAYDQVFWDSLDQWMHDFGVPEPGNGSHEFASTSSISYDGAAPAESQSIQTSFSFNGSHFPGNEASPPMSLELKSISEVSSVTPTTSLTGIFEAPALRCLHENCQSKKATFKRQSDLKRHSLKHEGKVAFECSATGCPRRGTKAFYRPDKLTEHIRRAHGHEAQFVCPFFGCQEGPFPLVLLGVHMSFCYGQCGGWKRELYIIWQPLFGAPFCPLKRCRKSHKHTAELIDHLQKQHSERDRVAQSSSMFAASLDPIACEVICPICGERFGALIDAFEHVLYHMVNKDLFQAWLIADNEDRRRRGLSGLTFYHLSFYNTGYEDSHRSMEVTSPELETNREAVLRLFPKLGWHSVFDDLKKK